MTVEIQSNVKDPERVRERRLQIVQAAVQLFTQKGFHKTTTREIASASGLSNGALYEYVQSKEDILFLVCQHIHKETARQLEMNLVAASSGAKRLHQAIYTLMRVIDGMRADVLLIYQESKSLPPAYLREVLKEEQRLTAVFEQLLREGLADGSLTVAETAVPLLAHSIIVSGQMWAFRQWALKDVSFEQFAKQQSRVLLQACGVQATLG